MNIYHSIDITQANIDAYKMEHSDFKQYCVSPKNYTIFIPYATTPPTIYEITQKILKREFDKRNPCENNDTSLSHFNNLPKLNEILNTGKARGGGKTKIQKTQNPPSDQTLKEIPKKTLKILHIHRAIFLIYAQPVGIELHN